MTAEHTKTPWGYQPDSESDYDRFEIIDDHREKNYSGAFIAGNISEANAAFIVNCVNNYAALVEALEWYAGEPDSKSEKYSIVDDKGQHLISLRVWGDKARKALANIKGKAK